MVSWRRPVSEASSAVPLTSPSPWETCGSPTESRRARRPAPGSASSRRRRSASCRCCRRGRPAGSSCAGPARPARRPSSRSAGRSGTRTPVERRLRGSPGRARRSSPARRRAGSPSSRRRKRAGELRLGVELVDRHPLLAEVRVEVAPVARRGSSRRAGAARRARIVTSSTSPGRAPSTAIGPVRMCGPGPRSLDRVEDRARCPSSISRSGASPAWWVTASIRTRSPEATVRTGSSAAVEVAPVDGLRRGRQVVDVHAAHTSRRTGVGS